MLYPQSNLFRQCIDLSGFWDLRFDPENLGRQSNWSAGFTGGRPAAVPASWNDQFEDGRDYLGNTWYQTRFDLPWGWDAARQHMRVRFNSVNYLAEVWLNGVRLGQHEGGHLPFEFDITPYAQRERNVLIARVEGELEPDRVPPGNVPADPKHMFISQTENYPPASFDFFPFCGIHRPVLVYATPRLAIADLTVTTSISGNTGIVRVKLNREEGDAATARFTLRGANVVTETTIAGAATEIELQVPDAALWSPDSPHLYDLSVELARGGETFDRYTLPIGIRTIAIQDDTLLLNGKPIYLKGFGRHEDFPIAGRGLMPALIVKDYALMKWIGANSFRTTHYPYSEQMMDLADRLGFLVIDETPAVGLFFAEEGLARRLELCRQYTQELVARDKNHPSVIAWSIANEPHSWLPAAKPFFKNLYDQCKSLDPTRPITLTTYIGVGEESFEFCDLMCLNRYFGWYSQSGKIAEGAACLSAELDALYQKYRKPLILTEFGADTISGFHAQPPEMFAEEFQAELLAAYIQVLRRKPFVIGEHVWNMCDFKTSQAVQRVGGMNLKGVFTRDRRPKLAAHRLREIWQ
ncbi:MAG: beta-glucuronidase [Chloroflexi bacterium]|nr:beta-glucuronidase [Chloroflexota bacterium]